MNTLFVYSIFWAFIRVHFEAILEKDLENFPINFFFELLNDWNMTKAHRSPSNISRNE